MTTKTIIFTSLVGIFCTVQLYSAELYSAELSGVDLFIKACQNQGLNNALIRTGYAEIEEIAFWRVDLEAERARFDRLIEEEQRRFANDPKVLNTYIPSLRKSKNELVEEVNKEFKYAILFKGNDSGKGLRRVFAEHRINHDKPWEEFYSMIVRGDVMGNDTTAMKDPMNYSYSISYGGHVLLKFQKLGRIHDHFSFVSTASMIDPSQQDNFVFLPNKVEDFKKMLKQLANQTNLSILQAVGTTPYDDGKANAVILESRNAKGIVYQRYWIDPARGYLCPLIQQFSPETGKITNEDSAKNYFLHERSGLWFPQECEEKIWNEQNGLLMESNHYLINPKTFQLNQAVSDHEFSLDVPDNFVVNDCRGGGNPCTTYVPLGKGTLSLAEGGLDLDKMSWLQKQERLEKFSVTPAAWNSPKFTVLYVNILILFIAIILYTLRRCFRGKNV